MRIFARHLEKWSVFWAVGLSLTVLFLDYATGPYISFPILFIFPVALVAWFGLCRRALMLAAFLCVARLGISCECPNFTPFDPSIILINAFICLVVLFLVAVLISRVSGQQRALQVKVRILEGILPVCGFCKKVRNKQDRWEHIETFISRNSEARFSHSVCPDCGRQHYSKFYDQTVPDSAPTITPP